MTMAPELVAWNATHEPSARAGLRGTRSTATVRSLRGKPNLYTSPGCSAPVRPNACSTAVQLTCSGGALAAVVCAAVPSSRASRPPQPRTTHVAPASTSGRWLLLFHRIPPKPDYFRMKVWRRLQRIGAVPVKNFVWVLPYGDQAVEDFRWLLQEIVDGGGEGSLCRGDFVDGLRDRDVAALFHQARQADYAGVVRDAKSLARAPAPAEVARLDRRLADV